MDRPPCRKLVLLCFFIVICFSSRHLWAQSAGNTVVKILNAHKTEYRRDPGTEEELVELSGNVSVTVANSGKHTTIIADYMTYNRRTNMLYAQGHVNLVQTGGSDGVQTMTANTLLFNTSTLEGVFDNARIVQMGGDSIGASADSKLVISSKLTGKSEGGTMSFDHATVTFCDDEDPHWKIRASKVWLLPGGEFAFLNAALYVGHIPVLYLPAFYYPKDELIFNPVIGYDSRKGYYLQTTTYLWGRKPLSAYEVEDEDETGFNFTRISRLKEQEREGLILHNLDKNYTGSTDEYLKLVADVYSSFGGTVGLNGAYKPKHFISSIEGFFNIGFSNTLFYRNNGFSRYSSKDHEVYRDESHFLGADFPFRYGGNFALSVNSPFTFSLSLPVYSDPYFLIDYGTRREYMDWIHFLTSNVDISDVQKNTDNDSRKVTSFTWNAEASYSAPLPEEVRPFISTLSIRNASSSIIFDSTTRVDEEFLASPKDWQTFSPERSFFYPSLVTPFRFSAEIAGTIYEFVPQKAQPLKEEESEEKPEKEKEDGDEEKQDFDGILSAKDLPDLQTAALPAKLSMEGFAYRLGYTVSPQYVSQVVYSTTAFAETNEFDWSNMYSAYYQLTSPVSLANRLSYFGDFLSFTDTLTFDPLYQSHPNLDGYATEDAKHSVWLSDYDARRLDFDSQNVLRFRPFIYDPIFKNTGLDWNSTVKIIRTKFIGDVDNPEWDYLTMDLTDKESVTAHSVTGYLSAAETEKTSQTLTLSSTLPPVDKEHDARLQLTFPIADFSFAVGVKEDADTGKLTDKPFQQSARVSVPDGPGLSESFNYDLEESHADSLKLALDYLGFQFAYTMQYTYGYDYDADKGWTSKPDMDFQPYTLSLAYVSPSKTFRYWKNRISWAPALNAGLVYDYLRPTDSYFKFIPSITLRINNFLDLTFSSESKNSVIFRYIQDYTKYGDIISGEKNFMQDLINSFAFWDTSLKTRKASGFKLKNLKITVEHNLHDWDFSSSFVFQPRLISDDGPRPYYSYEPYFTFAITWRPMTGIRTQIVDDYGEFHLNP